MTTSKVAKLNEITQSREKERDNKGNKYNHRWIYGKSYRVIEQLFSDHKNKIEKKDITNKKIMKP